MKTFPESDTQIHLLKKGLSLFFWSFSIFLALYHLGLVSVNAQNIPWNEDYFVIFDYLNQSAFERFKDCFHPMGDHQVGFPKAILELVLLINGEINFQYLSIIGNAMFVLMWMFLMIFLVKHQLPSYIAFIASLLIFSPSYQVPMLHSMSAISHLGIFFTSFMAFWCRFNAPFAYRKPVSLFFALLASLTRGDGVLVILLLFLYEFLDEIKKIYTRYICSVKGLIIICISAITILIIAYSSSYQLEDIPGQILFSLLVMGGIFKHNTVFSVLFSILALTLIVKVSTNGWKDKVPTLFYMSLFLIFSSFAIGYGRYSDGLKQAYASRYILNSVLLILNLYLMIMVNLFSDRKKWPVLINVLLIPLVLFHYVTWMEEFHFRAILFRARVKTEYLFLCTQNPEDTTINNEAFINHWRPLENAIDLKIYSPPKEIREIAEVIKVEKLKIPTRNSMPWVGDNY